jgi:hypothetical protein
MAESTYEGTEFIVSDEGTYSSCMTCTWQLISQDAENNKSTIRLRHYYYCGTNRTSGSGGCSFNLDGKITAWGDYTVYRGYTLIQTKDIDVYHNSNGDFPGRNVTISASGHTSVDGISKSGTITGVPKINRASTINSFTGNDIKGDFKATYTAGNESFENRLRISIPNVVALDTYRNYASGTAVRLSQESINYIRNYTKNKTIKLGGVIETWSGNTKIGESTELMIYPKVSREAHIRVNGVDKAAIPYVRVNNEWKESIPHMMVNGSWKEES